MWFARFPWPSAGATALTAAYPGLVVYRSEDSSEGCAYWAQAQRPDHLPPGAAVARLQALLSVDGTAAGRDAPWHYIVATDVLEAHEADFNAWYDTEHMPGLAAVPGTARTVRYRVIEGSGPRYHASYDLAERSAFNSDAWLAVRGTAWSSRVRPAFRNTVRTMFRRAA